MIKGSIKQKDTTIVNFYATKRGAPEYIKQTNRNKRDPEEGL